ncbi:MAG: efflux RND transporter periplasmic adaptor subunit [Spirochaetia bacterium]
MKKAAIFALIFNALFFGCKHRSAPAAGNSANSGNPNWPTATIDAMNEMELFSRLRYGGYLEPKASYPVLQPVPAVLRRIGVKVGDYVKKGQRLYSFQQVSPGTNYSSGWVIAQNDGYVSLINGIEGHSVTKDEQILVISDLSSEKLNFFLSNQHANQVKNGQNVYLASIIDEIKSLEQKISLRPNKETGEIFFKELEVQRALLEETKGQIVQVPIAPDEATGLFPVQVEFPVHPEFKIGRFMTIELHVDPYFGIAVQQQHLFRRYGEHQVRVVRDSTAEYQQVSVGKSYGDRVVIQEGLAPGDKIIIATNRYVRPGTKVNVVDLVEQRAAAQTAKEGGTPPPPPPSGERKP